MNIPKAIEQAMSFVLKKHAELGKGVMLRAYQSLADDPYWSPSTDLYFPMVDIRCSPPRTDQTQTTLVCECAMLCGTNAQDDKDHAFISSLYEAVEGVVTNIFAQYRHGTTGGIYAEFVAKVVELVDDAAKFNFGGLTLGEPLAPHDESGVNMIGLTLAVHYSRSDY